MSCAVSVVESRGLSLFIDIACSISALLPGKVGDSVMATMAMT